MSYNIYELISESYPNRNISKVILTHEELYTNEEFESFVMKAKSNIEDFIENNYDDSNDTMLFISEVMEDSRIDGIKYYLIFYFDFKEFSINCKARTYI